MENLFRLAQAGVRPIPDSFFWYTLCVLLLVFCVWVIKRYIDNTKDTFDTHGDLIRRMGDCIVQLTTLTKVHEVQIQALNKTVDGHDKEIESLRDFYIVKYKENGR